MMTLPTARAAGSEICSASLDFDLCGPTDEFFTAPFERRSWRLVPECRRMRAARHVAGGDFETQILK